MRSSTDVRCPAAGFAFSCATILFLCVAFQLRAQEASFDSIRDPGFFASAVYATANRLEPWDELGDDTTSPEPTFDERLSDLAESLAEDAQYRLFSSFDFDTSGLAPSDFEPSKVIDGDWRPVHNPKAIPYRAVCHVRAEWKKAKGKKVAAHATAFFVSPRVLMTSAHVLYDSKLGGFAEKVVVEPGRDGNSLPYGYGTSRKLRIHPYWPTYEYDASLKSTVDVGWIILPDDKLFRRIRFHFLVRKLPRADWVGKVQKWDLYSAGYPHPGKYKFRMYRDFERKDQVAGPASFLHYHDSEMGSSGMPLFRPSDGYPIVGVHSRKRLEGPYNEALMMTDWVVDRTRTYQRTFK